jgi:Flp pilus assembly protein protease CpaA
MLTIIFLLLATISDLYNRTIPNLILIPMFLVSLWLHQNNLPEFFLALLISSIIILILYKLNFFAGGDAKLLIILGATVGHPELFYLFATIFIIGGFQAIASKVWLIKRSDSEVLGLAFGERTSKTLNSAKKTLPYALSILLGYLIFILF